MNRRLFRILRFARRHSRGVVVLGARKAVAAGLSAALVVAPAVSGLFPRTAEAKARPPAPQIPASSSSQCTLHSAHGDVKHVIYIQFDNVHFTRDNPNVPSDLEQMPHLLNFFVNNGILSSNHHTPLISHTADDIITSLTGVYGERHGQPVSNSFNYFNPASSDSLGSTFTTSFTYWTDLVDPVADPTFSLLTPAGKNAPAPWVPFTRAGCNVGAVSIANMELENTRADITTVFGAGSPEAIEAVGSSSQATKDFVGIAIHCAVGDAVCAAGNSKPDVLPDEPGGYVGFSALYGHKYVAPVIAPGGLTDLFGNSITGFPGFGGISAAQSLAYTAAMQENGVPITYSYISDAHESHSFPFRAFGPGEAGYVKQLADYDSAFDKFFTRLANDGITPSNTLFILTADENDHFAGGPPLNGACDGVNTSCTYTPGSIGPNTVGEILTNIQALLGQKDPTLDFTKTPFDIHFDMAPAFYISGQPARDSAIARQFEHDAAALTAVNPRTGKVDMLTRFLADPVEMKLLHMITGDPLRTPSFVMFGDPDYFFQTFVPSGSPNVGVNPGFAWNHGGVAPEINNTFLGLAGPGVRNHGVTNAVWSDHTDIRPTLLSLVGLQDDYQSQGRVLAEDLHLWALTPGVQNSGAGFEELAKAYKRINAPVGELGLATLKISTAALAGNDETYNDLENRLQLITAFRDALAAEMLEHLTEAEFQGKRISGAEEQVLVVQANALVDYVNRLAARVGAPIAVNNTEHARIDPATDWIYDKSHPHA
jgi:hypothetical protein